ncbi:MAG: hypothetical protein AB8B91_00185 [Rubripirellula sp.]
MNTRRDFLLSSAATLAGASIGAESLLGQDASIGSPSIDVRQDVEVLMPRDRVPLSFVIDDSTCLVNMGHFCTPQFATAWPKRDEYKKPWREWPREIPDAFVREFGEWCAQNGVKGKYSIVPFPACVGWVDRVMPGWSRRELEDSLELVRDLMVPNWDIHPEMITHTRVIDLKTGRPRAEINAGTMENSFPQEKKSVDELASYLAYALRILHRAGLPCEGVTTPGGFGNLVKSELSMAVDQAVRDVYSTDLPHYFKYVRGGDQSTEPILEHLRGVGTNDVRLTVNVPAGTGDWFGGWQGDRKSETDRYATVDASEGRMVDLIQQRKPAVMLCHWPGMYSNGTKEGFHAFQRVVTSLHDRFADQSIWMKLSEIGRYWTAKQLTRIEKSNDSLVFNAPFATANFTIKIPSSKGRVRLGQEVLPQVTKLANLKSGTWVQQDEGIVVCFDLPQGPSTVFWST